MVTYFSLSVSQSHQPSCTPCLVVWKRFFSDIGHLLLSLSQSLSLINPLVPRVLLVGNVFSLILVTYFSLSLSVSQSHQPSCSPCLVVGKRFFPDIGHLLLSLSLSVSQSHQPSCTPCLVVGKRFFPDIGHLLLSLSQSLSLINPHVARVLLFGNVSSLILVTYFSLSLSVSQSHQPSCTPCLVVGKRFFPDIGHLLLSLSQSLSLINPLVARVLLLGNVSSLILVTYFSLSLSVSQSHQPSCSPCLVVGKRFFPDIGHLLLSLSLSL